jgi:hypothetical protein
MAVIKSQTVVKQWGIPIQYGAGRDKWFLDQAQTRIKEASPASVILKREPVSTATFGNTRDFLLVTHSALKEWVLYISAQNFGKDLSVSWYLTVNPGFFKRAISKKMTQDPHYLSKNLPVFAQQDLSSFVELAHIRVKQLANELIDDIGRNQSGVDWNPKGVLSIW